MSDACFAERVARTALIVHGSFFSYFTHLSYIGLVAYYFAAGVQTLCYALKGGKEYPLQKWPRPLQVLHTLLYSTITTYRESAAMSRLARSPLTRVIPQLSW